jgi:hypothetical protein
MRKDIRFSWGRRVAGLVLGACALWYWLPHGHSAQGDARAAALTVPVEHTTAMLQAPVTSWPAGEGGAIAQSKCLICHNAEIIQGQRLGAAQWKSEITKMTKWGAPLTAPEQATLAAYLAAHYNPQAAPLAPPVVHFQADKAKMK